MSTSDSSRALHPAMAGWKKKEGSFRSCDYADDLDATSRGGEFCIVREGRQAKLTGVGERERKGKALYNSL